MTISSTELDELRDPSLYREIIDRYRALEPIKLTPKLKAHLDWEYSLWRNIRFKSIRKFQAAIILYSGDKGTGKSFAAIADAIDTDPFFTLDQVVFSKEEAVEQFQLLKESKNKHPLIPRVLVWDEIGIGMYNREWYKKEQINVVKQLQAIRTTKITIFCCVPHIRFVDASLDSQLTFQIEMLEPNELSPVRLGKLLKKYGFLSERSPLKFRPLRHTDGQKFHIPYIDPRLTYPDLFNAYEKKRIEYADALMDESLEKTNDIRLTPRELEYAQLFWGGNSVQKIAEDMRVTERHVYRMQKKLRNKGALTHGGNTY